MRSGLGQNARHVARRDRVEKPPVERFVDDEVAEAAGRGDTDTCRTGHDADGAADRAAELEHAFDRGLVRRKERVDQDRQGGELRDLRKSSIRR